MVVQTGMKLQCIRCILDRHSVTTKFSSFLDAHERSMCDDYFVVLSNGMCVASFLPFFPKSLLLLLMVMMMAVVLLLLHCYSISHVRMLTKQPNQKEKKLKEEIFICSQ